jgi:hypothetical protein
MNSKLFIVGAVFLILNSCQVISLKNNSKNKFLENKNYSLPDVLSKKIFAKGKIKIKIGDRQQSLNINIKTSKDSVIMFSALLPIGIEVFRGQITNDSIYLVDRVNKKHQIVSLNSPNIIGISKVKIKDLIKTLFAEDEITSRKKDKIKEHQANTDKENIVYKKIFGQQIAKIFYSNYKYVEKINIPFSLIVSTENIEINLNYTQVVFLDNLKINKFKIPEGYEK